MLQFILGTAGTGKSVRLIQQIKVVVEQGLNAILLVPEQYSFEAERQLYRRLGPKLALQVEVLSFTRLCHTIFRKFGGMTGVTVSDAGKYMLMSVALSEVHDELELYRKSAINTSFLQTLVSTCSELKTAGFTPEKLESLAEDCAGTPLGDKLRELALIYQAYQGLLDRGYVDPDDDLIRALRLLQKQNCFGGMQVFVDGFTTFMSAEFALLGQIIAQADGVTLAMTADELNDPQYGTGVYSPVKSAAARLIRYAGQAGVSVKAPIVMEDSVRYSSSAIAYLSKQFLQPAAPSFVTNCTEAVQLHEGRDIYCELEYVAARIAQLVRQHGYRYRDIAVVARSTNLYLRAIQALFSRYDIPFFYDMREDVENLPLVSGLLSALDAVRSNLDAESVLSYAKSPIAGLDPESVAQLENYCYCWSVRGAVWLSPFQNNPRGFAETMTEEDAVQLHVINETRQRVIEPLAVLRATLKKTDGKCFATGIYDFLKQIQAGENLTANAQALPQGERESFLDQSAQLWDVLMEILDVFGSVLSGVGMTASRACELFRLAVNTAEIAQIPQTLDSVLVGDADRIRPGDVRAMFVIGANEGVFPLQTGGGGLFTDAERRQMHDMGAEISPPSLQQAILERYYAYFALTLPREQLCVSWSRTDSTGREQQPSLIIEQLRAIFPQVGQQKISSDLMLSGDKPALELLAECYRSDTPQTTAMVEYFAAAAPQALARIHNSAVRPGHKLRNPVSTTALFGHTMRLSPSRVERYYRCPFSYFAADGLSLKKRRKVEFSPLESGSVIHNVLQVMVQRHGGKGLAELTLDQLSEEIREIITGYLEGRVEDTSMLSKRFRYLFTRLTTMLARLLEHLGREFVQSEFEPLAVELPISRADGVEPLHLQTIDGVQVTVEGIVDRVDVMEKKGRRYVRVVDYKSGVREFGLHDVLYGLNLQMLLYLFTLSENGTGPLEGTVPAGVLYMPVRDRYITGSRDMPARELKKERERQWRMNGLLLEDEEVLRGMEQDLAGVFIPAKLDKSGDLDARSALASYAEMGELAQKVKQMVVNMATELSRGEIASCPTRGEDHDTCAYCDYRAVCGFEPGDVVRQVEKIDRKQFFKLLEEETNG